MLPPLLELLLPACTGTHAPSVQTLPPRQSALLLHAFLSEEVHAGNKKTARTRHNTGWDTARMGNSWGSACVVRQRGGFGLMGLPKAGRPAAFSQQDQAPATGDSVATMVRAGGFWTGWPGPSMRCRALTSMAPGPTAGKDGPCAGLPMPGGQLPNQPGALRRGCARRGHRAGRAPRLAVMERKRYPQSIMGPYSNVSGPSCVPSCASTSRRKLCFPSPNAHGVTVTR